MLRINILSNNTQSDANDGNVKQERFHAYGFNEHSCSWRRCGYNGGDGGYITAGNEHGFQEGRELSIRDKRPDDGSSDRGRDDRIFTALHNLEDDLTLRVQTLEHKIEALTSQHQQPQKGSQPIRPFPCTPAPEAAQDPSPMSAQPIRLLYQSVPGGWPSDTTETPAQRPPACNHAQGSEPNHQSPARSQDSSAEQSGEPRPPRSRESQADGSRPPSQTNGSDAYGGASRPLSRQQDDNEPGTCFDGDDMANNEAPADD